MIHSIMTERGAGAELGMKAAESMDTRIDKMVKHSTINNGGRQQWNAGGGMKANNE